MNEIERAYEDLMVHVERAADAVGATEGLAQTQFLLGLASHIRDIAIHLMGEKS